MSSLQIGVFADNLKLPLRDGIRKVKELGLSSFQIFTTTGELLPENCDAAARAEFKQFVADLGLTISATCADFGLGMVDAERNKQLIPMLQAQVDLARDLGVGIITTHIGTVPSKPDATWEVMADALNQIGKYAEDKGVVFATETGPESGPVLRAFLETLKTSAVRVNFDPANLTMAGYDLFEAVDALMPYIVHTHAKDGYVDPGKWREAPIGEGDVPWPGYIGTLKAHGYNGAYTIEREAGDDPIGDVKRAIEYLRSF
ncbi:MAG: sugar phosphate isomerase/epimerase family protein [Armatimonadota bacterium]